MINKHSKNKGNLLVQEYLFVLKRVLKELEI